MNTFLLSVGAEKAGTTWLHEYFRHHPQFLNVGKELNVIQRDDLVPTLVDLPNGFKSNIEEYFEYFSRADQVSGDFTHYEGSTENIFRLIKAGFSKKGIQVVPVYIMRDPIKRAWSSWNMIGGGDTNMPNAARFVMDNFLSCKYKETVQALDNVFEKPLYFFYETFFEQENIDTICKQLEIDSFPSSPERIVNRGNYGEIPEDFIDQFGKSVKNKEAVKFIFERFENVPWNLSDYS
jgi:hypothetical protein